ncbi:hypothetical protein MWH25_01215 [Natroniella acetigena]|uniref:hypothetical protein n=1 Tax=Natroniella acetigena TaxID=52004 RepID=UPI00200B8157|nr:hypothetical protein [Natroniella acetigena]MCK8826366.1 hypothetical protein [Natroniella acetigena]
MEAGEILKQQLEELCEVNSSLLEKAKQRELNDLEIETLEIVNYSISQIGNLLDLRF